MLSAFKFRLYPTEEQEAVLVKMVDAARRLWNDALAHRKWRWEEFRLSTSYSAQAWVLTEARKSDSELHELYSQAAQDILRRLDKAFKVFFQGVARYPRFKPTNGFGSFSYPQAYNGSVKLNEKTLDLSKIGDVSIVVHRDVPSNGRLKTCTVQKERCGEWYAVLTFEIPGQNPEPKTIFASPVGADLGLKSLIATTDGKKIGHPQFLRKSERRLKRLQRRLSRRQKGSKNREKARRLLAIQHAKVSREREDSNHKLTTDLVKRHDAIFFEDLRIKSMVKNHSLAKSISDAGWAQIQRFAEYKERRIGGIVATVPAEYSTQECFFCSVLNPIPLNIREFDCAGCGRKLDRDLNAARIVLKRGCAKVGQGMPELTPVEIVPPLSKPNLGASAIVEAGTIVGGPNGL